MDIVFIYKSTGQYLGFITNNNLFSHNGISLGWVDGNNNVWGMGGMFRGKLVEMEGNYYILRNIYDVSPVPKPPKIISPAPKIPTPPNINIPPIILPIGVRDGF